MKCLGRNVNENGSKSVNFQFSQQLSFAEMDYLSKKIHFEIISEPLGASKYLNFVFRPYF